LTPTEYKITNPAINYCSAPIVIFYKIIVLVDVLVIRNDDVFPMLIHIGDIIIVDEMYRVFLILAKY